MSSAQKASKVMRRKLDLGRCGTSAALMVDAALARANSVTTSAAVPATVARAARRVIFGLRNPSRLVTTSRRARGTQRATANARKCAVSRAVVNLGPWFDHHDLITISSANLESRKTTKNTPAFVPQSAMRSRDELKCHRKGARTVVTIVPK